MDGSGAAGDQTTTERQRLIKRRLREPKQCGGFKISLGRRNAPEQACPSGCTIVAAAVSGGAGFKGRLQADVYFKRDINI